MPTKTSLDSSNIHELLHEHLDTMFAECNHVMDNAADNVYLGTNNHPPRMTDSMNIGGH